MVLTTPTSQTTTYRHSVIMVMSLQCSLNVCIVVNIIISLSVLIKVTKVKHYCTAYGNTTSLNVQVCIHTHQYMYNVLSLKVKQLNTTNNTNL